MKTDRELAVERVRAYLVRHREIFDDRLRIVAAVVDNKGNNLMLTRDDIELLLPKRKVVRRKKNA